uniref:Uncharacterized protein n=1 Tax=Globisporangium ultimum (strain ATCC 200006 / CBS 805.95 / DAOM BR144) TaxID=431595 RepID=K3X7V0_GLOUD
MSALTFIHLASYVLLDLPSFGGLSNLKSMTLAGIQGLKQSPSLSSLRQLERLELLHFADMTGFPMFATLTELSYLYEIFQLAATDGLERVIFLNVRH